MHKALYLTLVALMGLLIACSTSVDTKNALVAERATIELYAIQGDSTGLAHLSLPFIANSENVIINVLADVNGDGAFDPTELLIENMPARAREGNINRYAFEVPDDFPQEVNLRVYTSKEALMELDDSYVAATAIVTELDVDDSIAVSAPGAHPDLKRGSFITLVSALPDGESTREGDIPDLKGGPMDCFPIATANNLISLANTHGIRDKLPDPQDMIDEMKEDMQFDDGVLKQNYLAGKQAFIDRYNLPIVTTSKERPTYEDIEDALANDCAIEISTTFLRSKSGKKDTGHVITGVGISADGDDVRLLVHDPATATGDDVYETEMTSGDNQFILIKNYPFWDGIMIIDALYIQCWDDNLAIQMGYDLRSVDEEPIGSVGVPFGEGTQTIDTLVIGGKHYPKTQFRIGSHNDAGCDGDHWHAGQVFSVETPEQGITDPLPNNCGFGIVGEVPEETISLTEEQASKWIGSILD